MDPLSCGWDTAKFFIFSDNVFAPLIYYSHLFALIPSLFIGIYIFLKDRKSLLGAILFFITGIFSLWVFSDLVLWANEKIDLQFFFWSLLVIIEPLIYAACLYFIRVFIDKKDISYEKKLGIFIFLIPTLILAGTKLALVGFDLSNCDRAIIEGPVTLYGYAVEIFYTVWILFFAIKRYRSADVVLRKQIALITLGMILFLTAFSWGNLIQSLSDNWTLGQYGLFGMPIFIAFLSYLIVKYKTFNIKLIGTQVLVVILGFLVLAIAFIRHIENIRYVVVFTFLFVVILGNLLVKSVKKEIEQRERLEQLRLKLEESNLKLEVANDKLKDLDKLKTEFLSLAAHQLRSPLTAIRGYTSMLLDGSYGAFEDKQKDAISRVFESSTHLSKVVEDLLNVSKIEAGGMKYEMAPFDMEKAAKDLATDLSITAEKKGLKLTFTTDNKAPYTINGDMEKLRQVMLNIIDNAIKYTEKGSITVSLSKIPDTGMIRLAVTDTGMGISAEEKEKLFQKFSRGAGGKTNTGGSGLGLYLAKQIAEAHGGHIMIDSPGVGLGSTFSIELKAV